VVRKTGNERGYHGEIEGIGKADVLFVSASEIAWYLKTGKAHMGITGADLVQERMTDWQARAQLLKPLGFGFADVVVAVPDCWLDVRTVAHLDELASSFRSAHGRWFRVATVLRQSRVQRLSHRRESGSNRGDASCGHGRFHRGHNDDRFDAEGQRSAYTRRWRYPEIGGEPLCFKSRRMVAEHT